MKVKVCLNKKKRGKVQIAVSNPDLRGAGPVKTYAKPEDAKNVLLAFGIPTHEVDKHFALLSEIGTDLLRISEHDISDDVLNAQGFRQ